MKSKRFSRVIAMVMLMILCMSTISTAFAASASYKGINSQTYTITTGSKSATLKVTDSAGKVYATAWKNPLKGTTKTVTRSMHGKFEITVKKSGSAAKTQVLNYPFGSKANFTLDEKSTYTVTVSCLGFSDQIISGWDPSWKTYPKVKLSVNHSAKIKK